MVFPALSARRTGRGRVPPHPKLGPFPECVERTEVEIEQAWGVLVDRRGEGRVPLSRFRYRHVAGQSQGRTEISAEGWTESPAATNAPVEFCCP